jgi:hypothetical protein
VIYHSSTEFAATAAGRGYNERKIANWYPHDKLLMSRAAPYEGYLSSVVVHPSPVINNSGPLGQVMTMSRLF